MDTIPDLDRRLQLLIRACHDLAARPHDEDLQQRVLRALVDCDLESPPTAPPLVRGVSNLARGYAAILRRQLETPRADHRLIARAAADVCHHMTALAHALGGDGLGSLSGLRGLTTESRRQLRD